ncbi:DNA-3-methyladenine glycosylase [Sediminibacterium sp. KACHI17]|uniref:DNA-3-methyladenine glycosylase II n=1 Tax=Sediminibacterium sp. KACHI17 TaxID=1751071 RepID=A0AAT9GK30_9BACT
MTAGSRFNEKDLVVICGRLSEKDPHLLQILENYGYPPFWSREPSFATLIHIILEQQVSLASAKAAFVKLKSFIGEIQPEKIMKLTDEELKMCYFSRQKTVYARCLAQAFIEGSITIEQLTNSSDEQIRAALTRIKGIGHWTVDVFLMMCLHSTDLFPFGDIALINSLKYVKQLPADTNKEELLAITESWKPYRTIASFMLWHAYIRRKNIVFESA